MRSLIEPRKPQTKVKHTILERYLKAWGGIILKGLEGPAWRASQAGRNFETHFVYVDCNASCGRFAGELEDQNKLAPPETIFGSPIIGIQALDSLVKTATEQGIRLRTNAILIEKETREFNELQVSLDMANMSQRVVETASFSTLSDGQIAVVRADSTTMAPDLVAYSQSKVKFSFYFLDPYGPKGIPLNFVSSIISQQRQDVMINMPYQDLHKKSGLITKPYLSPEEQELVKNYDEMFGTGTWRGIVKEMEEGKYFDVIGWGDESAENLTRRNEAEARRGEDLELSLINEYGASLRFTDTSLTVKSIGLHFPDKNRTMYYLYLTTHDPNGALAMNKLLFDADYQEYELRWRLKESKKHAPEQMTMFELPAPMPPAALAQKRATTEEIADNIAIMLSGRSMTRKEIYSYFADQPFFATEIDAALKHLKKTNRARYQAPLNNNTNIQIGSG